jgi:hypothetical protein
MFEVPFDEIAPIMGRTPAATRQLASRARRRVRPTPVAEQALGFLRRRGPDVIARPALVNGAVGRVVLRSGQPLAVMGFTVSCGRIVAIDILADPQRVRALDLAFLD